MVEAFVWAVNTLRDRHPNALNGLNIGAVAFDSCGLSSRIIQTVVNIDSCTVSYGGIVDNKRIMGYIGPQHNDVTLETVALFGQLQKSVISFAATNVDLSDNEQYPFFLRTVPSDIKQINAILSIMNGQSWKYAQVVYSSTGDNPELYQTLLEQSGQKAVCLINKIELISSSGASDHLTEIVESLMEYSETRVVILLLEAVEIRSLLGAVHGYGGTRGVFTWIGTRAWGDKESIIQGFEEITEGAITLTLGEPAPAEFSNIYSSIKPESNTYNPWFDKYWEEKFQCHLTGSSSAFPQECNTTRQTLSTFDLNNHLSYLIQASDDLLNGVDGAWRSQCQNSASLCSNFVNNVQRGVIINDKIHERRGGAGSGRVTDPPNGRYNVVNYRGRHGNCQGHCYAKIGDYMIDEDTLRYLLGQQPYFYNNNGRRLQDNEITAPTCYQDICKKCNTSGTLPSQTTTPRPPSETTSDPSAMTAAAVVSPPVEVRDNDWVIVLIVLAGLGILLVIIFEIYLLTKLLRDSGDNQWRTMWLGQLLLLAVFLCYLCAFAFVPSPTDVTCGIIRFGVGTSTSMCFSVLLVKLMIIMSSKTLYLRGIYQGLMFIFAWGLQIVIDIEWLILRKPEAIQNDQEQWVCKQDFEEHVKSLVYVMLLIVLCTFFAIRTHGIITNHREGIFIGLTAGFTIPIWLVWILIGLLNDDSSYEDPAMAFGLIGTATLVLFVMFLPKVRQLNSMGVEGIYGEDDTPDGYANSIIAPTSVIYGSPPSYQSKGSMIYLNGTNGGLNNGSIYYSHDDDAASVIHTKTSSSHVPYQADPNANFLRHPGSPQLELNQSVRGIPSHYGTNSRVLRVTNDLSGRHPSDDDRRARSEFSYPVEVASARGGSRMYGRDFNSQRNILRARSMTDLGAL